MKAAVLTDWKKIEIKEVPKPDISNEECLIKVKYAGICGTDLHIYEGNHPTAKPPVILCHEFLGTIEEIKTDKYCGLKKGDRVVVEPLISCMECDACINGNLQVCRSLKLLGIHTNGGFAEYVKAAAKKVIKVADIVPDEIAALAEPFAVGFHVNQQAGVKIGDNVLVIGGGPIGITIGMVAREAGVNDVVFSEINPDRIKLLKEFGFNNIINPVEEDAMEKVKEYAGIKGFDIVYEVTGTKSGIALALDACKIRGTVLQAGIPGKAPEVQLVKVIFKELKLIGSRNYSFEHFVKGVKTIEKIVEDKKYDLSKLISDIRPLEKVEEAIVDVKNGKNLGKVLIKL